MTRNFTASFRVLNDNRGGPGTLYQTGPGRGGTGESGTFQFAGSREAPFSELLGFLVKPCRNDPGGQPCTGGGNADFPNSGFGGQRRWLGAGPERAVHSARQDSEGRGATLPRRRHLRSGSGCAAPRAGRTPVVLVKWARPLSHCWGSVRGLGSAGAELSPSGRRAHCASPIGGPLSFRGRSLRSVRPSSSATGLDSGPQCAYGVLSLGRVFRAPV